MSARQSFQPSNLILATLCVCTTYPEHDSASLSHTFLVFITRPMSLHTNITIYCTTLLLYISEYCCRYAACRSQPCYIPRAFVIAFNLGRKLKATALYSYTPLSSTLVDSFPLQSYKVDFFYLQLVPLFCRILLTNLALEIDAAFPRDVRLRQAFSLAGSIYSRRQLTLARSCGLIEDDIITSRHPCEAW